MSSEPSVIAAGEDAGADAAPSGGGEKGGGIGSKLGRIWSDRRLRSEVLWVASHRVVEFVVVFALIKLLTNLLSQAQFGEYSLVVTAAALLSNLLIMPMNQAFLRNYHAAYQRKSEGTAAWRLVRWYSAATAVPVLVCLLLSVPVGGWLGFGGWTIAAGGLWYAMDRWRTLGVEIADLRRERKQCAMFSASFQALSIPVQYFALTQIGASATTALAASATLGFVIATLGLMPEWRRVRGAAADAPDELGALVRSFGVPAAMMLVFQWLQQFADRFILSGLESVDSGGVYIAALQIFGAPYLLCLNVLNWLALPVAYARAKDARDPAQLWSADKVLLGAVAAYVVIGLASLPLCFAVGGPLLKLMTNPTYQLESSVIGLMALGRFLQGLVVLLQMMFAIHQRMQASLGLRILGALLTLPICYFAVKQAGVFGAAAGTAVAFALYLLLLVFGPNGCYWLVRETRAALRGPPPARRLDAASAKS